MAFAMQILDSILRYSSPENVIRIPVTTAVRFLDKKQMKIF